MKIEKLTENQEVQKIVLQAAETINGGFPKVVLEAVKQRPYVSELKDALGKRYEKMLLDFGYRLMTGGTVAASVAAIKFIDDFEKDSDKYLTYMIEDLVRRALETNS